MKKLFLKGFCIVLSAMFAMMAMPMNIGAEETPATKYANHAPIPIYEDGNTPYLANGETIVPAIKPYIAANNPDGKAILVFPGGGYYYHEQSEAAPIAELYNRAGYTAFVVDYRLGTLGQANGISPRPEPTNDYHAILSDAIRAVKYVRAHAEEFGIDPDKIAVVGFSAGGHLCAMLATHFGFEIDDPTYVPDAIDAVSAKPDAAILSYPVVTLFSPYTFAYCAKAFTRNDPELSKTYSGELAVTEDTAPVFMWHRRGDTGVNPMNSMQFAAALQEKGVPYELHVFSKGGHGGAIGSYNNRANDASGQWFDLSLAFMDKMLAK